jgi:hypothetical protein
MCNWFHLFCPQVKNKLFLVTIMTVQILNPNILATQHANIKASLANDIGTVILLLTLTNRKCTVYAWQSRVILEIPLRWQHPEFSRYAYLLNTQYTLECLPACLTNRSHWILYIVNIQFYNLQPNIKGLKTKNKQITWMCRNNSNLPHCSAEPGRDPLQCGCRQSSLERRQFNWTRVCGSSVNMFLRISGWLSSTRSKIIKQFLIFLSL